MSGLTTHVLDLVLGRPAVEVAVRLRAPIGEGARLLVETCTDADGRARLVDGATLQAGGYRLEFDIGPYFRGRGAASGTPGFLETVLVDFHVLDPTAHHHVPLLASPFGYSTYRGS
jgi:5-hydroxyisourate hydrolase